MSSSQAFALAVAILCLLASSHGCSSDIDANNQATSRCPTKYVNVTPKPFWGGHTPSASSLCLSTNQKLHTLTEAMLPLLETDCPIVVEYGKVDDASECGAHELFAGDDLIDIRGFPDTTKGKRYFMTVRRSDGRTRFTDVELRREYFAGQLVGLSATVPLSQAALNPTLNGLAEYYVFVRDWQDSTIDRKYVWIQAFDKTYIACETHLPHLTLHQPIDGRCNKDALETNSGGGGEPPPD